MDKKPSISIKFKIILLMGISLLAALSFYTYYAISLFSEDKKAYIYENSLSTSTTILNEITSKLSSLERDIDIINKLIELKRKDKVKEIILKEKNVLGIFNFKENFFILGSEIQEQVDTIKSMEQAISSSLAENTLSTIKLSEEALVYKYKNHLYLININEFKNIIDQNRVYSSIILNNTNSVLFHNLVSNRGFAENFLPDLLASKDLEITDGNVKTLEINKEKILYSGNISKRIGLKIISIIDYKKAFFVTDYLVKKSILFGVFILLFISAVAILFSKSITNPIEKLVICAKEFAAGNFETNVPKLHNDEIGVLGSAFNFMIQEIKKYMVQMQEKIRLENELKVAKMVQENFFPGKDEEQENFEIAAFNEPSSECGGDWWGYYEYQDKLIFIIADATGHGVPAALLTASINTAFNAAKSLLVANILSADAKEITTFLNKTLSQTKTEILLTCFVGVVDLSKKTLNYTNSSHMDPLIIPQKNEALEKGDIIPLIEAKGSRLGRNHDFIYTSHLQELKSGDIILLQTDGIIEAKNSEGQEFGMRRLLKTILENSKTAKQLRDSILKNFHDFCKSKSYEDDITLVCLKIK